MVAVHRHVARQVSLAEQHGLVAELFDAAAGATSTQQLTSGQLFAARLYVPRAATVTNIIITVVTAGATLTAAQNLAALFDDAGNRLAVTADQATAWTSTGVKVMPLDTPQPVIGDTFVRVGLLSVGTTTPLIRMGSSSPSTANYGLPAAALRAATGATGLSAMPSTITPGSLSANGAFWVGLS